MKMDILELLHNMHIKDDAGFSRDDVKQKVIEEIKRLREDYNELRLDYYDCMERFERLYDRE